MSRNGEYHNPRQVDRWFLASNMNLKTRSMSHPIEANLTIVFTTLTVALFVQAQPLRAQMCRAIKPPKSNRIWRPPHLPSSS